MRCPSSRPGSPAAARAPTGSGGGWTGSLYDTFILADELIVDALVVGIADGSHRLLIGWLADEVGCVLVLPRALGAGHVLLYKLVDTGD